MGNSEGSPWLADLLVAIQAQFVRLLASVDVLDSVPPHGGWKA